MDDQSKPPARPWKRVAATTAVLVIATLAVMLLRQQAGSQQPYEHHFSVFGTYAKLTLWGNRKQAETACALVEQRLRQMHDRINVFDQHSELSQLNRTAATEPFLCTPQLWDMLVAARDAHRQTDGAFDVTVGPLMKLWGFHARRETYPDDEEVAAAREQVGLEHITFNDQERTVLFAQPGMYLDFGGFAKGYALDLAAEIIRAAGIDCGMADLGGNIYCFSLPPPGRDAYNIGIRHPVETDKLLSTEPILNQAVATSGNYENALYLEGRMVHHIVDPATGRPVPKVASVTVITRRGIDSDVYATAIFVRGLEIAEQFITDHPQSRVLFLSEDRGLVRRP